MNWQTIVGIMCTAIGTVLAAGKSEYSLYFGALFTLAGAFLITWGTKVESNRAEAKAELKHKELRQENKLLTKRNEELLQITSSIKDTTTGGDSFPDIQIISHGLFVYPKFLNNGNHVLENFKLRGVSVYDYKNYNVNQLWHAIAWSDLDFPSEVSVRDDLKKQATFPFIYSIDINDFKPGHKIEVKEFAIMGSFISNLSHNPTIEISGVVDGRAGLNFYCSSKHQNWVIMTRFSKIDSTGEFAHCYKVYKVVGSAFIPVKEYSTPEFPIEENSSNKWIE